VTTKRSTAAALLMLAALIVIYQVKLLSFMEWGDESETIVVAKLLASGMALYSEVFNHHGPLTFLPGYLLECVGSFGIGAHRVPIALLHWLALLAMYCSPLLRDHPGKRYFVAIAMAAMLILLPGDTLYGQAYVYQTIAGLLLIVILAQHTVPAIAGSEHISGAGVAVGSFLIACLPFLAVTYLPAAGLLFLCSLRPENARKSVLYAAAGLAFNLAFLALVGSFKGYWAFHFYLNANIMPLYNDGQNMAAMLDQLILLVTLRQEHLGNVVAFVALVLASLALIRKEAVSLPWRSALLFGALMSLQMRGFSIHGAPFCYAVIGLATLLLSMRAFSDRQHLAGLALVGLCALRLAYMLVLEPEYLELARRPDATAFSTLAKKITEPGDKVIAYTFQNYQYILAERLPASGNFFYLPWQERYNAAPLFGIRTHVCDDIKQARPKMMLIDKWKVWGKFPWDSYAGCVQALIDQDYRQLRKMPIYVRNDYYERALQALD
jgi:hypothetical protein